jgi:hypothetical protein
MSWKIVPSSLGPFKCYHCGNAFGEGEKLVVRHGSSYLQQYCIDCGISAIGKEEEALRRKRNEALGLKRAGALIGPTAVEDEIEQARRKL